MKLQVNEDAGGASKEVCDGRRNGRGRIPTQYLDEKRKKKIEGDREYRRKHKAQLDRFTAIASRFGGDNEKMDDKINQIEDKLHRLENMENKFGGMEEMESKLRIMEQVVPMFQGNAYLMASEIFRLKSIELQNIKDPQIDHLNKSAKPLQELGYPGVQSVDNNPLQGSSINWVKDYEICEMYLAVENGAMPEGPEQMYSDARVTEFVAKLDEKVLSVSCLLGFNDLHEECRYFDKCQISNDYTFSPCFNDYGDIIRSGHNLGADSFFSFLGAIEEMNNLSPEQVNEEIILKLRDQIKDAILNDCKLRYAMDHLKKIAYAYFGLKAQNDLSIVEKKLADLMAEENLLREKLENKVIAVKAMSAKKEQYLTSPLCNNCLGYAEQLLNRNIVAC